MEVHSQATGVEGIVALSEEGDHDTGKDITHTAGGHAGIAAAVNSDPAIRSSADCPGSLEHQIDPEPGGEIPGGPDSVPLDLGNRNSAEPGHFAGVGGQDDLPGCRGPEKFRLF